MVNQQERILIVDDEPATRKLITRRLSEEGYQCEEADSAAQVLDRLRSSKTELVILDIRMPGKSGIELLPEIKASHPDTAVIMVTALVEIASAVQCMKLGAEDYICKPFNVDELALTVERTLHKRKLRLKSNRYQWYLEDTVAPVIKDKALACLNSIETPLELKNAITIYTGKPVLSIRIAQRILTERAESGGFRELQQVAVVRGIGAERFDAIVNALGHSV
jgi:DNA-binding response OmpR family regulator